MGSGEQLLTVDPLDLQFPFELNKQINSTLQLTNNTNDHVGYKVKTTNPKKYCVRPNTGVVLPRSTCQIIVTMQAQKEAPIDMQCRDKFLLQSVTAKTGATAKDITPEMFTKDSGNRVEECKLKVVYIPPTQSTSAVGQGSKEVFSSNGSEGLKMHVDSHDKSSEVSRCVCATLCSVLFRVRSLIAKLTDEKNAAIEQSNRIRQELDLLRRGSNKRQGGGGVPLMFVIILGLIGFILGYIMKK
ncbi:hypothetical protein M8C21_023067 [Ambrosia artemisiifolia]|uniref:MSP domain-containing protein n=1 Tax=Ambrosia artemisiifolia TaxID=4212 RepID=A0AAD5BVI8_AMBAR|nr:hypothetical protein M8C21_023067 [Ambrosia artemisiifolia]